ncbi:hypothetical protein A3F07_03955 [candidate division WWE3 bacterium RIFCSPHIGHO2_12_FULL_38_15]|uniref:Uncharacterized protein n=1 Tax=candidate division WWE3 bacterium RIFCSPHIGHO2_02_FULL_38_14 TaxID=1802620 RepID=A0A1F4V7T3_UNCKA|nr:MAG: hypothetical protein A2793_00185 [candidate division WWE3 bacterium RIFCSPHIGHO2_01_FULL_38_45]OGC48965.1 MAG: hypothetical protein A3F07_03955 [candidate division WWE3 bacterium RIFCSPHIGHO2_12_FULL_38_15]OGC53271.1 MAG: hypothetical protein A3D91_02550 [candidate division WWE3 bacterium RIFCSPHIGHO2_02_FULL_38_14]OGC53710.1 MAG: hypothetical protein A3B64_04740 [candidate division WWE3 bacterium RIFCSPLOWO2_01_FULL_37_24]
MVEQIVLVLLLQLIFFGFYYKFGFSVARIIGRRVCPICFAVGSTWLTLLFLKYSHLVQIDRGIISLLLAESVVGVSYLTDEFIFVRQVKVPELLLKFGIIIFGTMAVLIYTLIHEILGLLLFAPVILFGFLALTPIIKAKESKEEKSSSLQSRLKNCC